MGSGQWAGGGQVQQQNKCPVIILLLKLQHVNKLFRVLNKAEINMIF